jgi:dipeptidyl aminopeptidase/acylaminoacyl peptidase
MGGYLTLRCMVIRKDVLVGVIWAGVVGSYPDLVYQWPGQTYEIPEKANAWRTSLEAIYGSPAQNPVFWDAISANSYLTELSGALQLHHGTADLEVPVEFSTRLYQRLIDIPIPAELYLYDNDNHNLSNSFDLAMKRTIQYFDAYLK